ncbi:MAG: hypothetical protein NTW29_15445 [Bacteroidetes bacterium]|nr:hypothetical protein [Bacteroidota bacterium]
MIKVGLKQEIDAGRKWTAEVANELGNYSEVAGVDNKFQIILPQGGISGAGDLDVFTDNLLIECKSSITPNTLGDKDFIEQFTKYLDPKSPKYINLFNRQVVLAVKELNGVSRLHRTFRKLERMGVKIITDLNQLKNL